MTLQQLRFKHPSAVIIRFVISAYRFVSGAVDWLILQYFVNMFRHDLVAHFRWCKACDNDFLMVACSEACC